jgi:hypothetical protein
MLGTAAARLPEARNRGEAAVALRAAIVQLQEVHDENVATAGQSGPLLDQDGDAVAGDSAEVAAAVAEERALSAASYFDSTAMLHSTLADSHAALGRWPEAAEAHRIALRTRDEQVRFFQAHLSAEEREHVSQEQPWANDLLYVLYALPTLTRLSHELLQPVVPGAAEQHAFPFPNATGSSSSSTAVIPPTPDPAQALLAARHAVRLVGLLAHLYHGNPAFQAVTVAAVVRSLGAEEEAEKLEEQLRSKGLHMLRHESIDPSSDALLSRPPPPPSSSSPSAASSLSQLSSSSAPPTPSSMAVSAERVLDASAMADLRAGLSFFLHCNGLQQDAEDEAAAEAHFDMEMKKKKATMAQQEKEAAAEGKSMTDGMGRDAAAIPAPEASKQPSVPIRVLTQTPMPMSLSWQYSSLEVRSDCAAAFVQLAAALRANGRPQDEVDAASRMAEQLASLEPEQETASKLEQQIVDVAAEAERIIRQAKLRKIVEMQEKAAAAANNDNARKQ